MYWFNIIKHLFQALTAVKALVPVLVATLAKAATPAKVDSPVKHTLDLQINTALLPAASVALLMARLVSVDPVLVHPALVDPASVDPVLVHPVSVALPLANTSPPTLAPEALAMATSTLNPDTVTKPGKTKVISTVFV